MSSPVAIDHAGHGDRSDQDRQASATLAAAVLGFFVITLDATIVNVALPSIQQSLGGGIAGLQWVVDGYTLMFAALLLSAGALSDAIGAKRAFGTGLLVFIVASVACGLAPTLPILIGSRFVQGCGAAIMMPSSMALIRHAYSDARPRARALAMWSMGGAVAAASGPFLGGLLSLASWRWIFVINVPVGLLAVVLLTRTQPSPHHRAPFDWAGQLTAMIAMGGLTYGAIEAGAAGFAAPIVIASLAAAAVAAIAFVVAQQRAEHPMVPLSLFRVRNVSSATAIGFAFMVGFYGAPFLFSLFLQQQRGLSPLAAGVVFLPMALVGVVLTPLAPRIVERLGPRAPIVTGLMLMVAGLIALALVPVETPVWVLAALLVPVGMVGPLVMPPTTAILLESVSARRAGTASGVFNTSRQVGGALAVAVFGALLAAPAGFNSGLHLSLVLAALVGAIAAATSLWLRPHPHSQEVTT